MKKILALLLALIFVFSFVACGDEDGDSSSTTTTTKDTSNPSDSDNPDVPNTPPKPDTPVGPSTGNKPDVDVTKPTVEGVMGDLLNVFTAEDTFGNEGKISSYTSYTNVDVSCLEGGKQYLIEKGGIYRVYGKSTNGQICVKATDQTVILLLDGVDMTYAGSSPVIYAEDCRAFSIVLAEGSTNTLADSDINGENGAIKVRSCDLVMGGKGKLTIKGNTKHAISNTKNLTINGGTYVISSVRHGIYGKLSVTINGGKFNINSARSGIKSGDDEVGKETEGKITINSCSARIKCYTNGINSYGSVEINNGRIVVDASGKGIVATKDININGGIMILNTVEDTIKSDTNVNIGGSSNLKIKTNGNGVEAVNATVNTTGVIYIETIPVFTEQVDGEYKLVNGKYVLLDGTESGSTKRYGVKECKGFEIKEKITVSGGNIGVDSFEDGLNAINIELSGGSFVIATQKDGMDASANITVSGSTNINVIESDKGLKATNAINLNAGSTTIMANTDAIKADTVTVLSGKHILFEKVEYVGSFTIRGGTFLSISTTNAPVAVKATIPNASGIINNKSMCVVGKYFTVRMGSATEYVVLQKDYTEKMSVLFATETQGECTVIIGQNEKTESLTQGKIYN